MFFSVFSNSSIIQSYLLTLPKNDAPKIILEMLEKIIKSDLQFNIFIKYFFPYINIALRMFLVNFYVAQLQ